MIKIAPSILSADFTKLGESVKKVEDAGCEYLHIDVMDGNYVPNISFGPVVFKELKKQCNMVFDCHLMIEKPERYFEDFVKSGADIITIHQEACPHLNRTISHIKSFGIKAGVSLNPSTSLSVLDYVLEELDMVLIMSVNPGFGGQSFIPQSTRKIRELKQKINEIGSKTLIEVDGGISAKNAGEVVRAGADILVAGSAIFGKEDTQKAVNDIRNASLLTIES